MLSIDVGDTIFFTAVNTLPETSTLFVTIVPYNLGGDAVGCTSQTFSTTVVPPACTVLTSTAAGSLNVSVTTDIAWQNSEGALGYFLRVGTTAGGSEIVNNIDVGNTTFISLNEDLPINSTIYVTIIPYNTGGMPAVCKEQTFETASGLILTENDQKFGFSPDGDGINEFWETKGINAYPDNVVSIYNRWGNLVFEMNNYNNAGNVFRGNANKATGIGAGELPEGTYFFTINIPVEHTLKKRGYVIIKR